MLDAEAIEAEVQGPLSLTYFRDPVLAEDGKYYERHKIESWIVVQLTQGTQLLSPLTRQPMGAVLKEAKQKREQTLAFVKRHGIHLGPVPASQLLPDERQKLSEEIGSRNVLRYAYSDMIKQKQAPAPLQVGDQQNTADEGAFARMLEEQIMKDRNDVIEAARKMEKLLVHHTSAKAGSTLGAMLQQAKVSHMIPSQRMEDIWYVNKWRNYLLHYDPEHPDRVKFDAEATRTFASRFRLGYDAMANAIFGVEDDGSGSYVGSDSEDSEDSGDSEDSEDSERFVGSNCCLINLKTVAYNGKTGTCGKWNIKKQRFAFIFDENIKSILVKPENLGLLGFKGQRVS